MVFGEILIVNGDTQTIPLLRLFTGQSLTDPSNRAQPEIFLSGRSYVTRRTIPTDLPQGRHKEHILNHKGFWICFHSIRLDFGFINPPAT